MAHGRWEIAYTPSFSTGAYGGTGVGVFATVGFSPTNNISDMTGSSIDAGGSAGPVVFGVQTPYDKQRGKVGTPTVYGGSQLCLGTCTFASGHLNYGETTHRPIYEGPPPEATPVSIQRIEPLAPWYSCMKIKKHINKQLDFGCDFLGMETA